MDAPSPDMHSPIEQALQAGKHIDLFCDYDGVLSAIAPRPQDACLDKNTKDILTQLAQRDALHVSIVSGRALADIRSRMGIPGITYVGNHGLEMEGADIQYRYSVPERMLDALRSLAAELRRTLQEYSGVIVEEKQPGVTVHFRQVSQEHVPLILERLSALVQPHANANLVRVTSGKEVREVRPAVDWDKGKAVQWLLRERHGADWHKKSFPVFLGDDETDEDAFRLLRDQGVTIRVGQASPEGTAAHFTLQDLAEVHMFLEWLLHSLP